MPQVKLYIFIKLQHGFERTTTTLLKMGCVYTLSVGVCIRKGCKYFAVLFVNECQLHCFILENLFQYLLVSVFGLERLYAIFCIAMNTFL